MRTAATEIQEDGYGGGGDAGQAIEEMGDN